MPTDKMTNGFTLIELMIVIAIIGVLASIAIPNFISYRDKTYCVMAEKDANNISSEIISYFSNPTHIDIIKADIDYVPSMNTFSITADNVNKSITITVVDVSDRCPSVNRNGWTGNVYEKKLE